MADEASQRAAPLIRDNMDFQRREWRAERIGWMFFALVIIGALLGLFGSGPLSSVAAESPNGAVRCEYERFCRAGSPVVLTIETTASASEFDVVMDTSYLGAFQVEHITPAPLRERAEGERTHLTFAAAAGAQATVKFDLVPRSAGRAKATITVNGAACHVSQIVYP